MAAPATNGQVLVCRADARKVAIVVVCNAAHARGGVLSACAATARATACAVVAFGTYLGLSSL